MRTKEVCAELGVTPKALRVYEAAGIVAPERKPSGYRDYSEADRLRLCEVLLLRELGFSVPEIKRMTVTESAAPRHWARSLAGQLRLAESRSSELENMRAVLRDGINEFLNQADCGFAAHAARLRAGLERNRLARAGWTDRWNFDGWAQSYDRSVRLAGGDLDLLAGYEQVMAIVRRAIGPTSGRKVLDIGCGTGNLLGGLSRDCEAVGIDQSLEMLLVAREKYPNLHLRVGNFLDPPYRRQYFDIVVSTYALHHLTPGEKETALACMGEYLKAGGKIIIADLMFPNLTEREKCQARYCAAGREDLWAEIADEYYADIEELERYVRTRGWRLANEHIINFTWLVTVSI